MYSQENAAVFSERSRIFWIAHPQLIMRATELHSASVCSAGRMFLAFEIQDDAARRALPYTFSVTPASLCDSSGDFQVTFILAELSNRSLALAKCEASHLSLLTIRSPYIMGCGARAAKKISRRPSRGSNDVLGRS